MLLEVVAAVDPGRVVELLGDVLEPGQEDHRVVADARPDRQQHRDRQHEAGSASHWIGLVDDARATGGRC